MEQREIDALKVVLRLGYKVGAPTAARAADAIEHLGDRQRIADEVYEMIKHGDDEHRRWLREKMNEWAAKASSPTT